MLLDVEGTGIQGPDVTEGFEFGFWEGPFEESTNREGKQLDNNTRHENGGICGGGESRLELSSERVLLTAQVEQLVERREGGREKEANYPP